MLIIIEGPDGAGKTTLCAELQSLLPLSTLLKLSGSPKHVDTPDYMERVYRSLLPFFEHVAVEQHVILDRFCLSERVYSKLFKPYEPSYLDDYEAKLASKLNVIQVYLEVSRPVLAERLRRKVTASPHEKHPTIEHAMRVKEVYERVLKEESKLPTLYLNADQDPPRALAERLIDRLGIRPAEMETAYTCSDPSPKNAPTASRENR